MRAIVMDSIETGVPSEDVWIPRDFSHGPTIPVAFMPETYRGVFHDRLLWSRVHFPFRGRV